MTGKYNKRQSWEKQTVYKLENGAKVTLEYNQHYGEYVSRIDLPNGDRWHCSNGNKDLPEFAQGWVEVVHALSNLSLVRPKFDRVY